MTFQIGQHVVCVDMTRRGDGLHPLYPGTKVPVLGDIYTVRDIFDAAPYGYDEPGLLLAEVVNPVRSYICKTRRLVRVEQFWLAFRFRPLRPTDISVFTAMLEPAPREPAELVDA